MTFLVGRYTWRMTDWTECYMEGSKDPSDCGSGLQTRQVFCVLDGDPENRPVEDVLCVQGRHP